ncbi:DUF4097 family beta strand repeat-containing protein [Streptomyces anulatus]|uniref:DUF4097 family beta strand repeat-containing protein n=1 Tax=Streptomyces anulatus TaxID=1892 RepID=UPI00386DB787
MTTSQTFTATAVGAVWADIISPVGTVTVTTDPALTHAVITVSTTDDDGPLAEAVANATHREHPYRGMECIRVDIPEPRGGTKYEGRSINVDVRLPTDTSSVRLDTTSADLTAHGDLQILDVHSVSGSIRAEGVHTLRATTTTGGALAQRVDYRVDVTTSTGDVHIGAYNGSEFRLNSLSGDVNVSATPAADGEMDITTVTGNVTTRGTDELDVRIRTTTGDLNRR